MNKDIKLFVSCHKSGVRIPSNSLLYPIQVGCASSNDLVPGFLRDDDGDSISSKNQSYCELTAQYWAWKNCEADYYGFLHYRRYFNFSDSHFAVHHEPFIFGDVVLDSNDDRALETICFEENRMREVIGAHDFIAPESVVSMGGESVYEQYRSSAGHHIEDFDVVLRAIEHRYPEIWPSAKKYIEQQRLYVCNMFIMKKQLFEDYSAFLFDVLSVHEESVDTSHYTVVGRRVAGYLAERICGIYLTYLFDQGYDGIELQRVYFRDPSTPHGQICIPLSDGISSPVRVYLGPTTRGEGKIYSAIQGIPKDSGYSVNVSSSLDEGTCLPAKVLASGGEQVLILPILNVQQRVEVEVRDAEGRLRGSVDESFSPWRSKFESQKNTLLRNDVALDIRNCDAAPIPGDVGVKPWRIIADIDNTDILQGFVSYSVGRGRGRELTEIVVLGPDGLKVSLGDWVCLGDDVEPINGLDGCSMRKISFSVRVRRLDSYTIWAHFPDGEHQDGFDCMEPLTVAGMRRGWIESTSPAGNSEDYEKWYMLLHRANAAELEMQRNLSFSLRPFFSIIVPLYKTPLSFFKEMAESVIGQTYGRWELVLVNASPDDVQLAEVISQYSGKDKRIRCIELKSNMGITENTNVGIKAAEGDFLSFLDHDDVLEPDALFCYARAINNDPKIDMLYCDEDKLCEDGYANPFFKPDWDPYLLLGMNYVCHFLTVRKSIVDGLELPKSEYDGSQDYHMTFRVGEKARHVHHEPRVLYHWRVHQHSTASRADQKDYALETSRLTVQTHLDRCGIQGVVLDSPLSPRRFVVAYDLGEEPLVSIVIPNKDAVPVLDRCLVSIASHTSYQNYEIIVVENNSSDPRTFAYYKRIQKEDPRISVVALEGMTSFNYSRICNYGALQSRGDYLLMLNNDTQVITESWIEQLLGTCMQRDVGITGAKLFFPDDTIQHAGVTFGFDGPCHLSYQRPRRDGGNFESTLLSRSIAAVTGACLMIKRGVYDAVGGMDEELSVNYNDVDLCLKVWQKGLRVVFCPTAELYHYESVSRGSEGNGAKALRFRTEKGEFMRRWPKVFEEGDPCGNPNLASGNPYEVLEWKPWREPWIS